MTYNVKQLARKIRFRGSMRQLAMGLREEQEHRRTVGNKPIIWAKIAQDHLRERGDYYTMLKKMEARRH